MNLKDAKKLIRNNNGMFYVYLMKKPDGRLFYVGKGGGGNGLRIYSHEYQAKKNFEKPSYKNNIIRKILNSGKEVNYEIVLFCKDELLAFSKEKELIFFYGKHSDRTGVLANLTDGGDGGNGGACIGQKRSEESKKRMSDARNKYPSPALGYRWTSEQKKRHSEVHMGYVMPEEIRNKIAESNRKTKNSPKYKKVRLKLAKLMSGENNPAKRLDVRLKISKAKTGGKFSEEAKGRMRVSRLRFLYGS